MSPEEWSERFGLGERLVFAAHGSGLVEGRIETELCSGRFFLHGAQVAGFQPRGGSEPWLFMSRHSNFAEGTPIRGGIPICFPWFGVHRSDPAAPAHGLVRTKSWKCIGSSDLGDKIEVTLELTVGLFQLHYLIRMGRTLEVELGIRNLAEIAQACEVALHTYFSVSAIDHVQVEGLDRFGYWDQLTGQEHRPMGRAIGFEAETDLIFEGEAEEICIRDAGWGRSLRLRPRGSRSTVVWNPWIAKSKRLADFGDEEYLRMVCVETANLGGYAVHLERGEQKRIAVAIEEA